MASSARRGVDHHAGRQPLHHGRSCDRRAALCSRTRHPSTNGRWCRKEIISRPHEDYMDRHRRTRRDRLECVAFLDFARYSGFMRLTPLMGTNQGQGGNRAEQMRRNFCADDRAGRPTAHRRRAAPLGGRGRQPASHGTTHEQVLIRAGDEDQLRTNQRTVTPIDTHR